MKLSLHIDSENGNINEYHGELLEQNSNSIKVRLDNSINVAKNTPCKIQVTVGNVLYCWDKATINPTSGLTAGSNSTNILTIIITTRPSIVLLQLKRPVRLTPESLTTSVLTDLLSFLIIHSLQTARVLKSLYRLKTSTFLATQFLKVKSFVHQTMKACIS